MKLTVSVTIGDDEVNLSVEEAKKLYEDLKPLFDGKVTLSEDHPYITPCNIEFTTTPPYQVGC